MDSRILNGPVKPSVDSGKGLFSDLKRIAAKNKRKQGRVTNVR